MQYLFSACAIQPDLYVIWSCSQWKITQFFGTGTGYWKVKKNKAILDSQRKRKECAPEFETQADYVIQRNYGGRLLMVATCVELLFILRKKSICQLCGLSRRADFVLITNQNVTELSATGFYFERNGSKFNLSTYVLLESSQCELMWVQLLLILE